MELVPRNKVYTGILKHIVINESIICRSMLFTLDKNFLAQDLIYTTPTKYPIYNFKYNSDIDKSFYIDTIVNMENILKYLNYDVLLSQNDLNTIYKKFITHDWWIKHSTDFFYEHNLSDNTKIKLLEIGKNRLGIPNTLEPSFGFIKRKQKDS